VRFASRFAFVFVVLITIGACNRPQTELGAPADPVRIALPSQIVGLKVAPEDVSSQAKEVQRPYIDSLAMYSLRENDLLRATLQVTRFNRQARPNSASFRRSIIGLMGSSSPIELQVGKSTVYATAGSEQNLFVWFESRGAFVLSVHQDFEFPRTLLRRVIELDLEA
jgi:hypothetical protein